MPQQLTYIAAPEVRVSWNTRYSSALVLLWSIIASSILSLVFNTAYGSAGFDWIGWAVMVAPLTMLAMGLKGVHDASRQRLMSLTFDAFCNGICFTITIGLAIHGF